MQWLSRPQMIVCALLIWAYELCTFVDPIVDGSQYGYGISRHSGCFGPYSGSCTPTGSWV